MEVAMVRWGKAGIRLTEAEIRRNDARRNRRRHDTAAQEQAAYRLWRAGKLVPARITSALDVRELYGPEVDRACGAEEPAVDEWEAGIRYPTWEQLCALSELTGFALRYFTIEPSFPLGWEDTSMRFHVKNYASLREKPRQPIAEFAPAAVAATVGQST